MTFLKKNYIYQNHV